MLSYLSLVPSTHWTISKNNSLTRIPNYYQLFTVTLPIVDIHVYSIEKKRACLAGDLAELKTNAPENM
jgi:hypothetical protein